MQLSNFILTRRNPKSLRPGFRLSTARSLMIVEKPLVGPAWSSVSGILVALGSCQPARAEKSVLYREVREHMNEVVRKKKTESL